MSTTSLNVTDNIGANCGLGHQQQDICEIDCANDGDLRGAPIHCGDAPHCSIHCSVKRCMRESIINATLSDSLYFSATAQECIKDSFIYFPINGNVTFIVDTLGLSGAHGIAKLVELHGESSDRIDILCKDPLHSEASKDDCAGMKIYAQGAEFLSVTVSGAEFQTDAQIYCPFHSDLEPSCVVNGTNAHQMTDKVVIHIGNGTVPKDLLWFGGSGDYGSGDTSIKVISSDGTCAINETSKTFENAGPCWKEITAAPTTTNPTTTPTASVTVEPTTSPNTVPPTTSPNTQAPTASPNTGAPTATGATNEPSTSPNTMTPSTSPTISTTSADEIWTSSTETIIEDIATSSHFFVTDSDENLATAKGAMDSTTLYIIIGASVSSFILLSIAAFFFRRHRVNKANQSSHSLDEHMSDNWLAGAGGNQLYRSQSAAGAGPANDAMNQNHSAPRQRPATYTSAASGAPPPPQVTYKYNNAAPIASMPMTSVMHNNAAAPASYPNAAYTSNIPYAVEGNMTPNTTADTNYNGASAAMPPMIAINNEKAPVQDTLTSIIQQHNSRDSDDGDEDEDDEDDDDDDDDDEEDKEEEDSDSYDMFTPLPNEDEDESD